MRVFVLGATGFLGGEICAQLKTAGHDIVGFSRSAEGAARLKALGYDVVIGDLEADPEVAYQAAREADATIYTAQLLLAPENAVITGFLNAIEGANKTFIFTSGTGVLGQRTAGAWSEDTFAEDEPFTPSKQIGARVDTENLVRDAVRRGVRGIVMRPPLIWGPGGSGHIASVYMSVARTGAACYIGEGLNMYSNVHVEDLADCYVRALEKGTPGALYHSVGGETPNRWIAEAVARDLGVETRSITMDEAMEIWGRFSTLIVMGVSSRSRSPRARKELGWEPRHHDMLTLVGSPELRALAKAKA